jgi:hypothetical protein
MKASTQILIGLAVAGLGLGAYYVLGPKRAAASAPPPKSYVQTPAPSPAASLNLGQIAATAQSLVSFGQDLFNNFHF